MTQNLTSIYYDITFNLNLPISQFDRILHLNGLLIFSFLRVFHPESNYFLLDLY